MFWPTTTARDESGRLLIGGVRAVDLAERFGTPLYVFDEATLRGTARRFRETFAAAYPRTRVVYAGKAYLSPALVSILHEEGLGLDVVSGGELYAGLVAGVDPSAITFHGNNKGEGELREAIGAGVGLVAIDNLLEIEVLDRLTRELAVTQPVLLRLNPGIEVETHRKMLTGAIDSKFGIPIDTGAGTEAADRILAAPALRLVGYHAHVGSQVFDPDLVGRTVGRLVDFAAETNRRTGVPPRVISPGGGFGVAEDPAERDASVEQWAAAAAATLLDGCGRHGLDLPELVVEPGRAVVGPAGVALYRVGSRKEIPGVRTYVSVDGGMADNPRPTLYGARYTAALANRHDDGATERVTIAGKYCESGDVLIDEIDLPPLRSGDLLATPMAGAYCLAMASNYNLAPRPAVVLVGGGRDRLIRRRETYEDLLRTELVPTAVAGPAREGETIGRR